MTKSDSFSSSWKEPENAGRFFSQALREARYVSAINCCACGATAAKNAARRP
jgi:hypothetical protein